MHSHFDSVVVVPVQHFHSLDSLGNWLPAFDQHPIDVESKRISVRDPGLAWQSGSDLSGCETFELPAGKLHHRGHLMVLAPLLQPVGRHNSRGALAESQVIGLEAGMIEAARLGPICGRAGGRIHCRSRRARRPCDSPGWREARGLFLARLDSVIYRSVGWKSFDSRY